MSDLRTAAHQALDILESEFTTVNGEFCRWCDGRLSAKHNCKLEQVITALRAALAEDALERMSEDERRLGIQMQPVLEPVAWQWLDTAHFRKKIPADATPSHWRPLYTAPVQRKED